MGEIAPRLITTGRNVLLVGQAPGADGDLRPLTGTMGVRLAQLAGVDGVGPRGAETTPLDRRIGIWFDRANVLDYYPGRDGKGHAFPPGAATAAADLMFDVLDSYDRVLFCGKAVYDAFRRVSRQRDKDPWPRDADKFRWYSDTWTTSFAWMPHTSMIVPWWNDAANVKLAETFLRDLVAWTRDRKLRSVA